MKRSLLLICALGSLSFVAAGAAEPNTLTPAEQKDGWKLLWDGRTTDGWVALKGKAFPAKGWEMAEGVLTVTGKGGGDIVTDRPYTNFELVAEFRITAGANSGIKYFIDPAKTGAVGFEFQILDDARHPDAKLGINGNRTEGALYDVLPPKADKPVRPVGEWNEARIVVRGNQIEHWLNGVKVVDVDRTSDAFRAAVASSKFKDVAVFGKLPAGRILLQDHGNVVSFRSLRIREVPAGNP